MAVEVFANQPSTAVTAGGTTAPVSGTGESWTVTSSTTFPAASSGATPPTQFHVADPARPTEIIAVTNVSGTAWTVTRGAESTTPVAHAAGFTVQQVVTAGGLGGLLQAAGGTMTGKLAPAVVTLTFVSSGTTTISATAGNAFALTLTDSTTTLGAPSNPVDGQTIRIRMIQGSGGQTIAYNSVYDFGAAGSPTLSTGAGKVDILGFEYVASLPKWCYLGAGFGF